VQLDGPPLDKNQKGWLANRSSLMNAGERRLVDQNSGSWNQIAPWLKRLNALRLAA
jgi:hypothetical protein